MATITLRLDDATRDEVERLARARGTTVSDLLRAAINELLGRDVQMVRADVPRSMDMIQRRSLALLHEVLALLSSDEDGTADYHRRRVQVLEEGFTAEYDDEFTAIMPELTPSECNMVWDILDMFTVLESSVARLGSAELAELGNGAARSVEFHGFDLNDPRESRLLGYVRFLVATDRWTNFADHLSDARERGNSHMPTLGTYQRMLIAFKPIHERKVSGRGLGPEAYNFNVTELRQVLDAWRYPRDAD